MVEFTVSVDEVLELRLLLDSIVLVEVVVVAVEARNAHFKLKGSVLIDLVVTFMPLTGKSSENARFLGDSETLLLGKFEEGGPDSHGDSVVREFSGDLFTKIEAGGGGGGGKFCPFGGWCSEGDFT